MYSKEFNSLDEIQKYYHEESNTYIFKEDGKYIALVVFNFDLNVEANIEACDINAQDIVARNIIANDIDACNIDANDIDAGNINTEDIKAKDINAWDINSGNINAKDISYWGVCFAYKNMKCKSIKGKRVNHKHFVLDGKLEVLEND